MMIERVFMELHLMGIIPKMCCLHGNQSLGIYGQIVTFQIRTFLEQNTMLLVGLLNYT